jgi:8-amino-7-oxononanoate synthase
MFEDGLEELKRKDLQRHILSRTSPQGPVITIEGKKYVNFSSNDYLGLAAHPEIAGASIAAVEKFGFGSGASRLLAGGSALHDKLEKKVSEFKTTEAAIVFNSGYAANTGVIPAIASAGDVIFSDEFNHASIIDGCRLSRARTVVYRHRDMSCLEKLIKKENTVRKIVITDSVFSMDGDIAPLGDISALCRKHGAMLYVDDAHGTGVLGNGAGALAHFNIRPEPWIIQMGTFSKALGSFGAFAAGSRDVIEWIMNTARSFIFSTALPASVVAASIAAISVVSRDRELMTRLWKNRERMFRGLREAGCDTMDSETPIIPVRTGDIGETLRLADYLWKNRIYAPAIRPPSVPGPRIRITLSALHTDRHINLLVNAIKRFNGKK